jgi:hypothetical protein
LCQRNLSGIVGKLVSELMRKKFFQVALPIGSLGVLQYGISKSFKWLGVCTNWYQSPVYNTEPGWARLTSCQSSFHRELNSGVAKFSSFNASMTKIEAIERNWVKAPIFVAKFMKDLGKFTPEMSTSDILKICCAEVEFKYARVKLNKFHECRTSMVEIG